MKTNSKNHPVFAYLADQIPTVETILREYGMTVEDTVSARLQWVINQFKSEYCYPENVKRYGSIQRIFAEWLMGLPSAYSVEFRNYEIIELAKQWESIPQMATEREEDKMLSNWFNFCANKFTQLCKFNKVEFKL